MALLSNKGPVPLRWHIARDPTSAAPTAGGVVVRPACGVLPPGGDAVLSVHAVEEERATMRTPRWHGRGPREVDFLVSLSCLSQKGRRGGWQGCPPAGGLRGEDGPAGRPAGASRCQDASPAADSGLAASPALTRMARLAWASSCHGARPRSTAVPPPPPHPPRVPTRPGVLPPADPGLPRVQPGRARADRPLQGAAPHGGAQALRGWRPAACWFAAPALPCLREVEAAGRWRRRAGGGRGLGAAPLLERPRAASARRTPVIAGVPCPLLKAGSPAEPPCEPAAAQLDSIQYWQLCV